MIGQYTDKGIDALNLPALKLCPFCGGEAGITQRGNSHTKKRSAAVRCKTSGCRIEMRVGAIHHTMSWCIEKAVEKWNTRTEATK